MYQLFLGDESFTSVVDRITDAACAVAPALDRAGCRELVELIFRARVRRTEACGHYPACRPEGPVHDDGQPPNGDSAQWQDADPQGLPAMFGVAAADLLRSPAAGRPELERRLAAAFEAVFGGLLFRNPRCGHARVCRGEPIFPYRTTRS